MARQQRRASRPQSVDTRARQVTLRTIDGDVCRIQFGKELQALAMQWNYIVGNRSRWSERKKSRDDVAQRATDALGELGVNTSHLRRMASATIVEVCVPFSKESIGWEARIMPWEFMLSSATEDYRGSSPLHVIRHLQRRGALPKRQPKKLAIVEAAPEPLSDEFDFEGEVNLINGSFYSSSADILPTIENPSPKSLRKKLAELKPDVIHVTGVDTHEGAELIALERSGPISDGLLLRGERQPIEQVDAISLAEHLTAASRKPLFVGFNFFNSADRIAPLTVGEGAQAAIAFQNTIDDSLAELFYVNFYRNWRESNCSK